MDWNLLGFIKASQYRQKILLTLERGNKTPRELRDELGYYMSHISHTLKNLSEKKLVICLTPELYRGKIFSLTELGQIMVSELKK
ncbi:hypothetical protein LCGC14_1071030 [marine sediment metagenome]|uniref:ArnR1-like winged helix-turn-helix domain-containing protein n=1 Tax=marine sediment metagenome TaxID=412755 RepID=A0A0F9Q1B1_9ZZZZ